MIRKTLLALAMLSVVGAAQASPYTFTGSFDTDPANIVITGLFDFDDSLVVADGDVNLSALSATFMGLSYALSDATDPYVTFENGMLTGPNALFALLGGDTLALQSFFGTSAFTYSTANGDALGTLTISAVPEPAALALSLAGLAAAALATTRRRRQTAIAV